VVVGDAEDEAGLRRLAGAHPVALVVSAFSAPARPTPAIEVPSVGAPPAEALVAPGPIAPGQVGEPPALAAAVTPPSRPLGLVPPRAPDAEPAASARSATELALERLRQLRRDRPAG
jgi:hypothetical protein